MPIYNFIHFTGKWLTLKVHEHTYILIWNLTGYWLKWDNYFSIHTKWMRACKKMGRTRFGILIVILYLSYNNGKIKIRRFITSYSQYTTVGCKMDHEMFCLKKIYISSLSAAWTTPPWGPCPAFCQYLQTRKTFPLICDLILVFLRCGSPQRDVCRR